MPTFLDEIGHLPGDRVLAVDVDMTQEDHTEWLRHALARGMEELDSGQWVDGEEMFAKMRKELFGDDI